MGILDEDGRPVSGAGALPFAGHGIGTGDKSGVNFTRNVMERPASADTAKREQFMLNFDKLIKEIGERPASAPEEQKAAPITDPKQIPPVYPPGTTDESRAIYGGSGESPEQRAERRARQRAEIKAEQEAKRKARAKERREAKQNGRTVDMSQPSVPVKRGRPRREPVEVRGDDEGSSLSSDGVSDLSWAGSDSGAGVSAAFAGDETASEGVQSAQPLTDLDDTAKHNLELQASWVIAHNPFHVNHQMFMSLSLEQAENLLNDLRDQVGKLAEALGARREVERQDDSKICTWCKQPFPGGVFFARFPFELQLGSGQWRAITSCRRGECLAKYNAMVEEIQRQLKAER